jgi:glycosyltransferase involved in cell wall biosynthesis
MKMKKIAIVHPSADLYGADRIMVAAAKSMTHFQAHIFLPREGPLIEFIKSEVPSAKVTISPSLPIIQRSMFSIKGVLQVIKSVYTFKKFFRRENERYDYQVIYINTLASVLTLFSLRKLKVPLLIHVHEIIENPKIVAKLTSCIAVKYANKVVCVSKAVRDNIQGNCRFSLDHVIIIRNGIKPIQEKVSLPNFKIEFYLFGRIKPEKGQWYLLEALKYVDKSVLKFAHFNLVGGTVEGSEHLIENLRSIISQQKLSQRINLIDFTSDISELLSKADVCLVPSLMKDPFPTTVLEAMSLGKTIITTDGGGAKEAIENGTSGIVIPANDPQFFAEKIEAVILNRKMAKEMGLRARNRYQKYFTEDHFSSKWNEMIREISSQFGKIKPDMVLLEK